MLDINPHCSIFLVIINSSTEVRPHLHYLVQVAILPVSKYNLSLQAVLINLNWSSRTIIQTHDAFYILFRCIIQSSCVMESLQWNAAQHAAVSFTAPFAPKACSSQANQPVVIGNIMLMLPDNDFLNLRTPSTWYAYTASSCSSWNISAAPCAPHWPKHR